MIICWPSNLNLTGVQLVDARRDKDNTAMTIRKPTKTNLNFHILRPTSILGVKFEF